MKLMEAVRVFTIRELFKISSFEEETGRILAFRNTMTSRAEDAKTIIMHVNIIATSPTTCEVNARFTYSRPSAVLSKDDESVLTDCYIGLFDLLDGEVR
jgi:hypothetical protein